MKRSRTWTYATTLLLLGGCFPPIEEHDLDSGDTSVIEDTSIEDLAQDSTAKDTMSSDLDTLVVDTSDTDAPDAAEVDAGECSRPEDCPAVEGPCRERTCVEHTCEVVNVEGTCDDGDKCTTGDHCAGGGCVSTPVTCYPLDSCHEKGQCDPGSGVCSNPTLEDSTFCDDGDRCTVTDTCDGGVCEGAGTPDDGPGNWSALVANDEDQQLLGTIHDGASTFVLASTQSDLLTLGMDYQGNAVTVTKDAASEAATYIAELGPDGRPVRAKVVMTGAEPITIGRDFAPGPSSNGFVFALAFDGLVSFANGDTANAGSTGQFAVVRVTSDLDVSWVVWTESTGSEGSLADDAATLSIAVSPSGEIALGVTCAGQLLLHPTSGALVTLGIPEGSAPGNKGSIAGHLVVLTSAGSVSFEELFEPLEGVLGGVFPKALGFSTNGRLIVAGAGGGGFSFLGSEVAMQPLTTLAPVVLSLSPSHTLEWIRRGKTTTTTKVSTMSATDDGCAVLVLTDGRLESWIDEAGQAVAASPWEGPLLVVLDPTGSVVAQAGAYSDGELTVEDIAVTSSVVTIVGTIKGNGLFAGSPPTFVTPSVADEDALFVARWALPDMTLTFASSLGGEGAALAGRDTYQGMYVGATETGLVVGTRYRGTSEAGEPGITSQFETSSADAALLLHVNSANAIGCAPNE